MDAGLLRPRRIDPRVGGTNINPLGLGLDPGTQSRHCELYRAERRRFPMAQWWIIDIMLPAVLLIILVALVLRRGSTGKSGRTKQATHDLYQEEEQSRREGTDA